MDLIQIMPTVGRCSICGARMLGIGSNGNREHEWATMPENMRMAEAEEFA